MHDQDEIYQTPPDWPKTLPWIILAKQVPEWKSEMTKRCMQINYDEGNEYNAHAFGIPKAMVLPGSDQSIKAGMGHEAFIAVRRSSDEHSADAGVGPNRKKD
jgi:hypothetical protein